MPASKVESDRASRGCTCLRVRKAARRVTQIYDRELAPFDLTITQYGLLAHLARHEGISIGALAELLIMDPTTLTRNLRPLERAGLLTLAPDVDDRRTRRAALTDAGRARLAEAKSAWARAQHQVEAALGPELAAALNGTLDRALERLAKGQGA